MNLKKPHLIFGILGVASIAFIVWGATKAQVYSESTTFVKHYRIEDNSDVRGLLPTEDGNYVLTGQAIYDKQLGNFSDQDAFIAKVDAKGNPLWTKILKTSNAVYVDKNYIGKNGEESGRDIIELKDGSLLMASQGTGFVDSKYLKLKERWDDVFLTKFDAKGNHLWTKMLGDYSTDSVRKLYATTDGGFVFSGYSTQTGFGEKTAPKYFVVAKFDKNGLKKWSQKIEMSDAEIELLPDGSFIALGNVKTAGHIGSTEKFESADEIPFVPVAVKFNAKFGLEWARSLEIVPEEESVYTVDEAGKTHMTYRTTRRAAGKFISIKAVDGGYVALGFLSPLLSAGSIWSTPAGKYSLAAIKLDTAGNLQWARAIKLGIQFGGQFNNDISGTKIIKTADNGFVFELDFRPSPRADQENKQALVDEKLDQLNTLCAAKNRTADCDNGKITNDPELLAAWEDYIKTAKSFETRLNNGLILLKTDANFNPQWSKKVALEDYIYGYSVAPTADNGLIIGGSYQTSILNYSNAMGQGYFQDTLLLKLDVNGDVTNNQGMLTDYTDLTVSDVSSFLTLKNFPPVVKTLAFKIDKKVIPKTPAFTTKVIDIYATAVKLVAPAPPVIPNPPTGGEGSLFSSSTSQLPPVAQSWAEINYAKAPETETIKPIYKTAIEVDQEILPALNQIFANKVKRGKDVFGGLEYIFGRLATASDITATQKHLEGLGYKTYLAEGNQLVMMKIGRTLTLTFPLQDKTKGTLFVTY